MPRFEPPNSETYPHEPWSRLDRAVKAVTSAGLEAADRRRVLRPAMGGQKRKFRPTLPGRYRWKPDPELFAQFAEAVARRYSGSAPRPRAIRAAAARPCTCGRPGTSRTTRLPASAVAARGGSVDPALAAHLPRDARARLRGDQADQPGEPGPAGRHSRARLRRPADPRKAVPPLQFLRELACVDRRGRPLERSAMCSDFEPLQADGYAHHPYSLYDRPDVPSVNPDDVQMGDLERLSRVLDRPAPARPHHHAAADLPDRVRLRDQPARRRARRQPAQQARYHGLATYPRVEAAGHLDVRAVPPVRHRAAAGRREWPDRGVARLADRPLLPRRAGRRSPPSRRSSCRSGRRHSRSPGATWRSCSGR